MPGRYDEQMPPELEPIAAQLRADRAELDPLASDRLKQRLMATNKSRPGRQTFMKSRIAGILTAVALTAGAGGALAIASSSDHHSQVGAATGQYCNKKGQGHGKGKCKGHHKHPGHCSKKGGDHGNCKGHQKAHGHKTHHKTHGHKGHGHGH